MEEPKVKKKRAPTALLISCGVCGSPAPDHLHFGGHCCYSCRAFFRRTIERMEKTDIVCRTRLKNCEVSETSKSCAACRYERCLQVGMTSSLLQGKRRKKEQLESTQNKMQKVNEDVPKLEMILPNNSITRQENLQKNNHCIIAAHEQSRHLEPLINPVHGNFDSQDSKKLLRYRHHFKESIPPLEPNVTSRTFDSRSLSTSENDQRYDTPSRLFKYSQVIHGPTQRFEDDQFAIQRMENTKNSTAREDSLVFPQRSPRTSVIRRGPITSPQNRLQLNNTPEQEMFGRSQMEPPPMIPIPRARDLLQHKVNILKHQAEVYQHRSNSLSSAARMLEEQEIILKAAEAPLLDKFSSQNLENGGASHTKNLIKQPSVGLSENCDDIDISLQNSASFLETSVQPNPQRFRESIIIKKEIIEEKEESQKDEPNNQDRTENYSEEADQRQKDFLYEDIKSLFLELVDPEKGDRSLEGKTFSSDLFLDSQNILENSPFSMLLTKTDSISAVNQEDSTNNDLEKSIDSGIKTVKNQLKVWDFNSVSAMFNFHSSDMNWVDKIHQTMAICTKSMIRNTAYQAVIDNWRGEISHQKMLEILAKGRSRQAYMHILIISNLPYFKDLSARTQQWLVKSAAVIGTELMAAVFFFAHEAETLVEQAEIVD